MSSHPARHLRPSLIRLILLAVGRKPTPATTRAKPADLGAMSAHICRDIGLDCR